MKRSLSPVDEFVLTPTASVKNTAITWDKVYSHLMRDIFNQNPVN